MADASQLLECYGRFRVLSKTRPVLVSDESGTWNVCDYDDVKRVLSDHEVFSSVRSDPAWPQDNPLTGSMFLTDPPRQRRLRGLVGQAFAPRRIAALESRIAEVTRDLLDPACAAGEVDVVADVARALPSTVIADLLGIEYGLMPTFERWARALFVAMSGPPDAAQALVLQEMEDYFLTTARDRRARPRDDFFTALAQAQVDGQPLGDVDLVKFCNLLLVAGYETTKNLIGNAVICLESCPEVFDRVRRDLSLVPAVVEETLRFMTPVRYTVRVTRTDARVGNQFIPAGRSVLAWMALANRDPKRFPDPDRFDPDRDTSHHLAFGHGTHFCLGIQLARLEARIALTAMLERFPGTWRLPEGPLEAVPAPNLTGATTLPLTWSG
jgi:cytochrome P450